MFLITPSGSRIHLAINNRVPYFEDVSDSVSEPDFEFHVSSLPYEVAANDFVVSSLPHIE